MAAATIIHGDARQLPLDDCTVDAAICDPPYSLPGGFMGKDWDRHDSPAAFQAWCEEWAREALRVLKPGGHMIAFGGTRTFHRLTCAIEDAGFEIRDSIGHAHTVPVMGWVQGQGFPKSLDVSRAIDRAAGAERQIVGERVMHKRPSINGNYDDAGRTTDNYNDDPRRQSVRMEPVTAPATDDARRWQGFGTALRPSWEPIVVARKPLAGKTVAQNVLAYGCGALNIDATRVGTGDDRTSGGNAMGGGWHGGALVRPTGGRWPSNVVFSHVARLDVDGQVIGDACADGCVDGCAVAELDTQSGHSKSSTDPNRFKGQRKFTGDAYASDAYSLAMESGEARIYGDSGGASRYFPTFRYQAKAPSRERPKVNGVAHPTVKPVDLLRWIVRLCGGQPGSLILDMFAGSGSTIEAALLEGFNAVGVEQAAEYLPLIQHRIDRATAALAAQQKAEPEAEPTLFDVA